MVAHLCGLLLGNVVRNVALGWVASEEAQLKSLL